MSVTTTADERLEDARENVIDAVKNLHKFLDPDTWGHDDYTEEFKSEVLETCKQLLDIREKLGG